MKLTVNDSDYLTEAGTVAELVAEHVDASPDALPATGIAVALDGEVVPRSAWATTVVDEGARVDILTAVQGG